MLGLWGIRYFTCRLWKEVLFQAEPCLGFLVNSVAPHPGNFLPNSGLSYLFWSIGAQSCPQLSCQENQLKPQKLFCPEMLGDFALPCNVGATQSQWPADIRAQSWFPLPQWGMGNSVVPFLLLTPRRIRLRPDASWHHVLSQLFPWSYPFLVISCELTPIKPLA